jgi:shikimate kinase
MRISSHEFRNSERKAVTLLGMSGVGKTRLARLLRRSHWFHYSGDYRIGTRYLDEEILNEIKRQAMDNTLLRDLLRSDSIHLANNISVDNLKPLSSFLGKLGNPEQGGLGLREFKRRQQLHRQAEIAAMLDVPEFIARAQRIYGYANFVNDAGGSLCELDDERVIETLAQHSIILYIEASAADEAELIRRAIADPKPMFYRESFLDEQLAVFMKERALEYAALIDPDQFVRWVFPRLFHARVPRYAALAGGHGYVIRCQDMAAVQTETDFLKLVSAALDRTH